MSEASASNQPRVTVFNGFLNQKRISSVFLKKTKQDWRFFSLITFRASVVPCVDFRNQRPSFITSMYQCITIRNRPRILQRTFDTEFSTCRHDIAIVVSIASSNAVGQVRLPSRCNSFLDPERQAIKGSYNIQSLFLFRVSHRKFVSCQCLSRTKFVVCNKSNSYKRPRMTSFKVPWGFPTDLMRGI